MSVSDKNLTAIQLAAELPGLIAQARSSSLIEYTQPTRVEPLALVDQRVAALPYAEDIVASALNIFTGYYLQAVALSVEVGRVDVIRLLDKLNPRRDPIDSLGGSRWIDYSKESLESLSLPFKNDAQRLQHAYSQEMLSGQIGPTSVNKNDDEKKDNKKVVDGLGVPGQTRVVNENANLSVGKLIEVDVESEGRKAKFPVMIRMIANTIKPDVMSHILSLSFKDNSLKERWHQWRSGQINFIEDLILCQDLIDEQKKTLMEDKTGYYRDRIKTRRNNRLSAILSGNPSVALASSVYIMTTDTASDLEGKLRGRLKRFKDREKFFKENNGMMLFIVDADYEQVTIYHRSIEQSSELSIREIQRKGKDKGPDILDILKAFQERKAPTF